MKIFISHAWDHSELYSDLVELLRDILGFRWTNISIPKNEAFELATGVVEFEQRRRLLEERISIIQRRAPLLDRKISDVRDKISEMEGELARIGEIANTSTLIDEARENILRPGALEKIQRLERLQRKYENVDFSSSEAEAHQQIKALTDVRRHLEREGEQMIRDMTNCTNELGRLDVHVLAKIGTPGEALYRTYPNLAMAIGNRITDADVVLIISLTNSAFLKWIEFEYVEAINRQKHVIAILHPTYCPQLPPDLRLRGIASAPWEFHIIRKKILAIAREIALDLDHGDA